MAKRNLTLQLDEEVLMRAKVIAAKSDTSVSRLVADLLEHMTDAENGYELAKQRALEVMRRVADHADKAPTGVGRRWSREDLHEREELPQGPRPQEEKGA
ncbi:MAG: DUF6364 family protein [Actinomycetota bacterium]